MGHADLIAFGRPFLANPDLIERMRTGASLNAPDFSTFYSPGAKGYTDYPTPEQYVGKAIELAGDELTLEQIVTAINRATGRKLSGGSAAQSQGVDAETGLVRFMGWHADIPALRAMHPPLMTFDTWLVTGGALMINALLDHSNRPS